MFNGDVWNSLKPQEQEWIKSAANEAFLIWWTKWQKQNAEALKELQEKHGVQILHTPAEILREFLKGWDKLVADESAKNPFFKKVLDSQKAYASLVVPMKRAYFPPYSFLANYYFPPKRVTASEPRRGGLSGRPASRSGAGRRDERPAPGCCNATCRELRPWLNRRPRCWRPSGPSTNSPTGPARSSPGCRSRSSLAVAYEVIARYLFNAPTIWAFDVTYMLYGTLFMLGAAYALHKGAHIRTDFFWEQFSTRKKG